MTYLESITYLTGNYLQVCQFVVKNAFRVVALSEGKDRETYYLKGSESLTEALEAIAQGYLKEHGSDSDRELEEFFSSHNGLSKKSQADLKKVLDRRSYLISYFYIENSPAFGREEEAVYEAKIKELKEYVSFANDLNVSLSKAAVRLYDSF